LKTRAQIAKNNGSDLFVSLHINSGPASATGAEIWIPRYFYNSEMTVFGNDVLSNINSMTGFRNNGVKTRNCTDNELYTVDANGAPNGSVHPGNAAYSSYASERNKLLADYYTVINESVKNQIPGCIIEHAYVSNDSDRSKLTNDSVLKALGEADAKAIIKYFESGVKANDTYRNITETPTEPEEPETDIPEVDTEEIGVAYKPHVQDYGWTNWYYNGEEAGTTGQGKRVEAFKIYPYNLPGGATISAEAHIQDYGWRSYTIDSEGGMIGTTGEGKRIEAVTFTLNNAPGYEIEYRVHVQNIGWTKWVSQGEIAGTSGLGYRLEALELRIISTEEKETSVPYVTYQAHVQDKGWLDWVSEYSLCGTSGLGKRMESFKISLHNAEPGMYISGYAHIQDYGWLYYKNITSDTMVGTSGEGKRIESLNLTLNGTDKYKLQYRVHIQDYGWTGWIDQGNNAGTTGQGKRLEAIEIRLVEK
jgi:uncharacterized protein YjdB